MSRVFDKQASSSSSSTAASVNTKAAPRHAASNLQQAVGNRAVSRLLRPSFPGFTMATSKTSLYVVKEGDTLSSIALKFLGAASRWTEIYEENRDVIGENAAVIEPGMELTVHLPVDVYDVKDAMLNALDPHAGLMRVKGEALEYLKIHPVTEQLRTTFEQYLRQEVSQHHRAEGTAASPLFGQYPQPLLVVSYGGNMWDASEYYSPKLGTWLIGNCYPRVNYEVSWTTLAGGGWSADWEAEWVIDDDYDLQPGPGKDWFYNAVATVLTAGWHDTLGGRRNAPIQAKWTESGTLQGK